MKKVSYIHAKIIVGIRRIIAGISDL
jgi:hypothetical protein